MAARRPRKGFGFGRHTRRIRLVASRCRCLGLVERLAHLHDQVKCVLEYRCRREIGASEVVLKGDTGILNGF